jgi:hypothetical protein
MFLKNFMNTLSETVASVDHGENIFEMPMFQDPGDTSPRRVVNTGIAFHRWNAKNNLEAWVCDYGATDQSEIQANRDPHVHKILYDYSAHETIVSNATPTTILESIRLSITVSRRTVQGIDVDGNGKLWISDYNSLVQIEPVADGNGNAVVLQSFAITSINGIAYNPTTNRLVLKIDGDVNLKEYDLSGNLKNSNFLTVNNGIEGLTIDDANQMLYGASGGNFNGEGARIRKYNLATGSLIWTSSAYANAKSNEGLMLVQNGTDTPYFYQNSNAEFHPATDPTLRKNTTNKWDATVGINA